MIKIFWHGFVLREFAMDEEAKALNAWDFFNGFLLKEKLELKYEGK